RRVFLNVDEVVLNALLAEELLRAFAVAAPGRAVDRDLRHRARSPPRARDRATARRSIAHGRREATKAALTESENLQQQAPAAIGRSRPAWRTATDRR